LKKLARRSGRETRGPSPPVVSRKPLARRQRTLTRGEEKRTRARRTSDRVVACVDLAVVAVPAIAKSS